MRNATWEPVSVETLALPSDDDCIVGTFVASNGSALILSAHNKKDTKASVKERLGGVIFSKSLSPIDSALSLTIQGNGATKKIRLPSVELLFPYFDIFSDGGCLLVGARSSWRSENDFDLNGVLIKVGTTAIKRVCLGDGIEGVGLDDFDRIWISYFDEGVYGNFGWSHPGPTGLGAGGVNCFDRTGELLWQHNRETAAEHIDDCYAMNVSPFGIWFYFYSAFKLARITKDFSAEYFETPLAGSKRFITDGCRFVFSSQFHEPTNTYHATSLCSGKLVHRRKFSLSLPEDADPDHITTIARGDKLHVFFDKKWLIYELDSLDYY